MKVNGKTVQLNLVETIVIPRGEDEYVFKARLITEECKRRFEEVCPKPKPKTKIIAKTREAVPFYEDPEYQQALVRHSELKYAWSVLESLKATEGLEWETVDYDDPNTWDNYWDELVESGFSNVEISSILGIVVKANGLSEKRIEEATKDFLSKSRLQAGESKSSPEGVQQNTQSTEPVKG